MKARESGMPEEKLWSTYFDPEVILTQLGLIEAMYDVADFGCGYGTFTLAAARKVKGMVYALDIEPEMIDATKEKAETANLSNIQTCLRDFMAEGSGLDPESVDYVMLFNILHAEQPVGLLREAWRILRPGGKAGIMHWRYDPTTPRGPSMEIRPKPEQCLQWILAAGLQIVNSLIELPPYHYGMIGCKGDYK